MKNVSKALLVNKVSKAVEGLGIIYRTRAIITRSWSKTALVYKLRILGLKNEEFSFLDINGL